MTPSAGIIAKVITAEPIRLRWSRPYFNIEEYKKGRSSGTCQKCQAITSAEYCETNQSEPTNLALWIPLCHQCNKTTPKIPTWQESTEEFLKPLLFPNKAN